MVETPLVAAVRKARLDVGSLEIRALDAQIASEAPKMEWATIYGRLRADREALGAKVPRAVYECLLVARGKPVPTGDVLGTFGAREEHFADPDAAAEVLTDAVLRFDGAISSASLAV